MLSFASAPTISISKASYTGKKSVHAAVPLRCKSFCRGSLPFPLPCLGKRVTVCTTNQDPVRSATNISIGERQKDDFSLENRSLQLNVKTLHEKVSSTTEEETTPLDDIISCAEETKDFTPEQLLQAVLGDSTATGGANEEWLDREQELLLSLVTEEKDVLGSSQEAVDSGSIAEAVSFLSSQGRPSEDIRATPAPAEDRTTDREEREITANVAPLRPTPAKHRMVALQRRRQRLAQQDDRSGDTSMSTFDLSEHHPGPLEDVFRLVERNRLAETLSSSITNVRVVDSITDSGPSKHGALTSAAARLIPEICRCPFSYGPFLGLQRAFDNFEHPPCPRCGKKVSMYSFPASSASDSLCVTCYREIYFDESSEAVSTCTGDEWEDEYGRVERKREEARVAAEALDLVMKIQGHGHPGQLLSTRVAVPNMTLPTEAQGQTRDKARPVTSSSEASNTGLSANGSDGIPRSPNLAHREDGWNVQASKRSMRTINPIRNLIQNMKVEPNPDKELIKLSIGDPTAYGNLKVSEKALAKYCEVIRSSAANGYSLSMGSPEARAAVAARYSSSQSPLSADDVFLAGGTSGALELAIGALANEGDNVLLPRPGFPLFVTLAENYGIECRYYRVNPDRNWEIELSDLIELADNRTSAILVNNPSNPCGSVYSEAHIEDLLATASALKVPIVADEVYADMVFAGHTFVSVGRKSVDVPVLCVGGISKQFVVPGWRLGWVLMHDRNGIFDTGGIRKGIRQLTTRMLVPNTPAQAVLPTLLAGGVQDVAFLAVMKELETNANFTVKSLENAKGLRVIEPQGSMYVMVEVDVNLLGFKDDMEFTEKLVEEESVFVLPGQCFQAPNFVRIVFAAPREVLSDAFFRIRSFCSRHAGGM